MLQKTFIRMLPKISSLDMCAHICLVWFTWSENLKINHAVPSRVIKYVLETYAQGGVMHAQNSEVNIPDLYLF